MKDFFVIHKLINIQKETQPHQAYEFIQKGEKLFMSKNLETMKIGFKACKIGLS